MIRLTRLNNQQITLNSDLIKLVESKPDTVITLINGEKLLVHETVDEVRARVIEFRRAVIAGVVNFASDPGVALSASNSVNTDRNMLPAAEKGTSGG